MKTHAEIIALIGTFKKGVPFTLTDLNVKFSHQGVSIFLIGVYYDLILPNGHYKAIQGKTHTPYFIFV